MAAPVPEKVTTQLPIDSVEARHAQLVARATYVYGDRLVALNWLYEPNDFLDGQLPVECAASPAGMARVEKLLTQTEYNVLP